MDNVSRKANDRGKIRTLGGRACHFDLMAANCNLVYLNHYL